MKDRFLTYNGHMFDDWGTECSKDFRSFSAKFKNYLKRNLPAGAEIVKHSCGHYFLSGFVKYGDRCVYYSYSWNRFSPLDVYSGKAVLARYARDEKDTTGFRNRFSSIAGLPEFIANMLTGKERVA